MKIIKYLILSLIILNIPEVVVRNFGAALGTISSYSVFIFLFFYFLMVKRENRVNFILLAIGLLYFLISSFNSYWELQEFFFFSAKFIAFVIFGNEFVKTVSVKEISVFFYLGSITIILHPILFANTYGRYSGFYFNPNQAAFIAITSFALSFTITNYSKNLMAVLISSFAGFLTFSRTFIILWLISNLISLRLNLKNFKVLAYGIIGIIIIYNFSGELQLNTKRFNQYKAIVTNDMSDASGLKEDSRTATWRLYYDAIFERPFLGNGFHYFQGGYIATVGVHNSFLLILGEAGLVPFILFISLFIHLLFWSWKFFKSAPHLFFMTISLTMVLMADHGYFKFYIFVFLTMWLQYQIRLLRENQNGSNIITS